MPSRGKSITPIEANSAPLWDVAYRLQQVDPVDLRTIPFIVGGEPRTRQGIVLTGETLSAALKKCPHLTIVQPGYDLYMQSSMLTPAECHQLSPELPTRQAGMHIYEKSPCKHPDTRYRYTSYARR